MEIFGTTIQPWGAPTFATKFTCPDPVRAHVDALAYLRRGGVSAALNCGYDPAFQCIETVERVSGANVKGEFAGRPAAACDRVSAPRSDGNRILTTWEQSSPKR